MKSLVSFFMGTTVLASIALAQDAVTVTINPTTIRSIGGVTEFKREQFITMHTAPDELEYTDEDLRFLEEELEISYGRDGGTRSYWRGLTKEDPNRPGFPNVEQIKEYSKKRREELKGNPRNRESSTREVVSATHPELFYAKPDQKSAPFGPASFEAAAEFSAQFMKHFWTDAGRPKYFEVFNEPFVHAKSIGATVEGFSEQHVVVAKRLKELVPDVLVGGYTAAWVEYDARNFAAWDDWQKKFMDIAGDHMDFFSYHIYDGINVIGKARNRTGSNSEAIMDLIDSYSFIKWGVAKPLVISEYGLIHEGESTPSPYSPAKEAGMLRSFNGMLSTFMDHPDRLIKTVPFILGKADWTYTDKGGSVESPYPYLIWRKSGDDYVTTELVQFYQFWKGIKGEWRVSDATDPDIITHVLQDGKRLTVILTSLDEADKKITLEGLKDLIVDKVALRSLTTHDGVPFFSQRTLTELPDEMILHRGQSAAFLIDTRYPVKPEKTLEEHRVYPTTYLQDIKENETITFTYNNVPAGGSSAILRLGIGREKGKSFQPKVVINGKEFSILTDWSGDDQAGRKTFFGVIEVPIAEVEFSNTTKVDVTFPDTGGKLASAILQINVAK